MIKFCLGSIFGFINGFVVGYLFRKGHYEGTNNH